jgi:hypothetical protein
MSVYFIRVGRYFKIGASEEPVRRYANLRKSGTRYTFPIDADASWLAGDHELFRVVDGWKDRERLIHLALDAFTVGLEWFLDEPAVREFIVSLPANEPERLAELPRIPRDGGFDVEEYHRVQHGRAEREMARFYARRSA